MMILEYN